MSHTNGEPRTISARSLIAVIASSLAIIGGMSALHANYVIPKIMLEASAIVERELAQHAQVPLHPGGMPRAETEARLSSIDQRLSRIEARLDRALDNNGGGK